MSMPNCSVPSEAWFTWVGGTDYDMNAGDTAHGYSFKGADPHAALVKLLTKATSPTLSYAKPALCSVNTVQICLGYWSLIGLVNDAGILGRAS